MAIIPFRYHRINFERWVNVIETRILSRYNFLDLKVGLKQEEYRHYQKWAYGNGSPSRANILPFIEIRRGRYFLLMKKATKTFINRIQRKCVRQQIIIAISTKWHWRNLTWYPHLYKKIMHEKVRKINEFFIYSFIL